MTERFTIRTTPTDDDIAIMHRYLSTETYWANHVPYAVVKKSVENSLTFLVDETETGTLAAFARVVTDKATFAYLCDVFVIEAYRGQGIGKQMMAAILDHPDLQGLRRFLLFTLDAHGLYAQYGFTTLEFPDRAMQIVVPNPYNR